jgi:hypothetical protein
VLRKPVVVPKSGRSIPPQITNEEPGPDGNEAGYRPHSGPYGLRHSAIHLQGEKGGDRRDHCSTSKPELPVLAPLPYLPSGN